MAWASKQLARLAPLALFLFFPFFFLHTDFFFYWRMSATALGENAEKKGQRVVC